jgi:hypothetical protein
MVSAVSNLNSNRTAPSAAVAPKRVEPSAVAPIASGTSSPSSTSGSSDTVTISKDAQALALYTQGMDLTQIAFRLGTDVDSLKRMLGLSSLNASSASIANAQAGDASSVDSLAPLLQRPLGLYTRRGGVV